MISAMIHMDTPCFSPFAPFSEAFCSEGDEFSPLFAGAVPAASFIFVSDDDGTAAGLRLTAPCFMPSFVFSVMKAVSHARGAFQLIVHSLAEYASI